MSSKITFRVQSAVSQTQLQNDVVAQGGRNQATKLKNFLSACESGAGAAVITVLNQASAAGTATIASSGAQSFTVNGDTLTGGTDYVIANLTATQCAVNLAAAINSSTDGNIQLVSAQSLAAVVTVTAKDSGLVGNLIPISGSGTITASGVTLAGGTSGTASVHQYSLNKALVS